MLTFQKIQLESNHGDEDAVLILRSERLVAIASFLGAQHGPSSGQWYVEAVFSEDRRLVGQCCQSLDELTSLVNRV